MQFKSSEHLPVAKPLVQCSITPPLIHMHTSFSSTADDLSLSAQRQLIRPVLSPGREHICRVMLQIAVVHHNYPLVSNSLSIISYIRFFKSPHSVISYD